MTYKMTVPQIKEAIREKLSHSFGVSLENATYEESVSYTHLDVYKRQHRHRSFLPGTIIGFRQFHLQALACALHYAVQRTLRHMDRNPGFLARCV